MGRTFNIIFCLLLVVSLAACNVNQNPQSGDTLTAAVPTEQDSGEQAGPSKQEQQTEGEEGEGSQQPSEAVPTEQDSGEQAGPSKQEQQAEGKESEGSQQPSEAASTEQDSGEQADPGKQEQQMEEKESEGSQQPLEAAPTEQGSGEQTDTDRQIQITTTEGNRLVFQLNDSPAAESFYRQLPLSIQIEDFAGSEKIFYLPEELETADTPMAQGPAGTLAYYKPWGNVAIFYGECGGASGLYGLGSVLSGAEEIKELSGEIQVEGYLQSGQTHEKTQKIQ